MQNNPLSMLMQHAASLTLTGLPRSLTGAEDQVMTGADESQPLCHSPHSKKKKELQSTFFGASGCPK